MCVRVSVYHVHICVWMCATSVCICLYICICRYVRFSYPRLLRVCNERLCVHMLTPHLSHTQTYMHTYTYIRSIFISHILIILKHIHTCKHRLNWSLLLKLCNPVASARNTDAATYIRYTHTHTYSDSSWNPSDSADCVPCAPRQPSSRAAKTKEMW